MSAHVEKIQGEYWIINNNTGKKEKGPYQLRETANAEIAKRERENKNKLKLI